MPKTKAFKRGDEELVRVVHVEDPHNFYVRRVGDDDWIQTFKELVEAHPTSQFPRSSSPNIGQLVLLDHPKHGWARGMITRVQNDCCYVKTFDYGDEVFTKFTDLRRLDFGDATAPKAIHCSLYMCHPKKGKSWSQSNINTFIDYAGDRPVDMTVIDRKDSNNQLIVELNSGWPETVSQMMVMAEAACIGSKLQNEIGHKAVSKIDKGNFVYDSMEIDKVTDVQILKIKGAIFYCVKATRNNDYISIYDLLETEFGNCPVLTDEDKVAGTPVVCKLTKRAIEHYFRGEIYKISNKKVKIFLVDIGDYENIDLTNDTVRKCNLQLRNHPTFAIPCKLNSEYLSKTNNLVLSPGLCLCIKTRKIDYNLHNVEIVNSTV